MQTDPTPPPDAVAHSDPSPACRYSSVQYDIDIVPQRRALHHESQFLSARLLARGDAFALMCRTSPIVIAVPFPAFSPSL